MNWILYLKPILKIISIIVYKSGFVFVCEWF